MIIRVLKGMLFAIAFLVLIIITMIFLAFVEGIGICFLFVGAGGMIMTLFEEGDIDKDMLELEYLKLLGIGAFIVTIAEIIRIGINI